MKGARAVRPRRGVHDAHQWRLWLSGLFGSRYDGLEHFHVVESGVLMRSGQPRVSDLEYIRAEYGLRAVVCARGGTRHPLRGRWFARERAYCEREAIQFAHLPFSDADVPPPEIFDRFLSVAIRPEHQPLLVHCEQGFHRSGMLCAAYRIRVSKWPWEKVLAELRQFGFDPGDTKRQRLIQGLEAWAEQRESDRA